MIKSITHDGVAQHTKVSVYESSELCSSDFRLSLSEQSKDIYAKEGIESGLAKRRKKRLNRGNTTQLAIDNMYFNTSEFKQKQLRKF